MKINKRLQLQQELRAAGAEADEVQALLPIAAKLSWLRGVSNPDPVGHRHGQRFIKPVILGASGLALSAFVIIVSLTVLPTNPLFPVQKVVDSLAIDLHPAYRARVMMKRAQQVNELVDRHASSRDILATLADYSTQTSAYQTAPHTNYAAFQYCKSHLEQAATAAAPDVRQAILHSLASLETS